MTDDMIRRGGMKKEEEVEEKRMAVAEAVEWGNEVFGANGTTPRCGPLLAPSLTGAIFPPPPATAELSHAYFYLLAPRVPVRLRPSFVDVVSRRPFLCFSICSLRHHRMPVYGYSNILFNRKSIWEFAVT